jgi:hypothetical protein
MAASFTDQIRAEAAAIDKALKDTVRVVAIECFGGVIMGTPVGNPSLWKSPAPPGYTGGTARANWQLTNAAPATGEVNATDSGTATRSAVISELPRLQFTGKYTLANNVPYIERLEDGWSTQAPQGMVKLNVARVEPMIPRIYQAALRRNGAR